MNTLSPPITPYGMANESTHGWGAKVVCIIAVFVQNEEYKWAIIEVIGKWPDNSDDEETYYG